MWLKLPHCFDFVYTCGSKYKLYFSALLSALSAVLSREVRFVRSSLSTSVQHSGLQGQPFPTTHFCMAIIDRYTQFFSQYKMVLLLQQYFILIEKLRISIDICHTKMGSWKWRTLYIDHDRVCVRYVYLYVCSFWDKNGIAKSRPTMHFLPNYCE